jgi:hypothetical protein
MRQSSNQFPVVKKRKKYIKIVHSLYAWNKSNIDRDQETLQGGMVSMSVVDDYLGERLFKLEVHLIYLIWLRDDSKESTNLLCGQEWGHYALVVAGLSCSAG